MFKKIAVASLLFMIFASAPQAKEESSIKTKTDIFTTHILKLRTMQ